MAFSASGVRVRVRVRVYVDFQWAGPVWVLLRWHPCACRRLAWAREDSSRLYKYCYFASRRLIHPAAHSSSCQPDRLPKLVAGGPAQSLVPRHQTLGVSMLLTLRGLGRLRSGLLVFGRQQWAPYAVA